MFGTRGYLIAMHVPSKFVRNKNELLRRLRRLEGVIDVKKEWKFLEELKEYGYPSILSTSVSSPLDRQGPPVQNREAMFHPETCDLFPSL